jgi:tRNA (guanine37-N1)-methyltransferase
MTWKAIVLTLFPDLFPGPLGASIPGRALKLGQWAIQADSMRDYAKDNHRTVDDTPYGGGAGMVIKPEIVHEALQNAVQQFRALPPIIFLSPRGIPLKQHYLQTLSQAPEGIIVLCGHYEGVDERVIEYWRQHKNLVELSLGDYILSCGEIAAYGLLDGCVRLLPNVLKNPEATEIESFSEDLLEFAQYTKPNEWMGLEVPQVLRSGHHANIRKWRQESAQAVTRERRPDLWEKFINSSKTQSRSGEC